MTNLTTFFAADSLAMATIIHGGKTVVLTGFSPEDLQHEHWSRPGTATSHPDPDEPSLVAEFTRKQNQVRAAWWLAWAMSLIAVIAITYVFTAR